MSAKLAAPQSGRVMDVVDVKAALDAVYAALRAYQDGKAPGTCLRVGMLPSDLSAVYLAIENAILGKAP